MAAPFINIPTHRVPPEQREPFQNLAHEYTEFLKAEEPDLSGHHAYFDLASHEASLVQMHRSSDSAERHMQLAGSLIR